MHINHPQHRQRRAAYEFDRSVLYKPHTHNTLTSVKLYKQQSRYVRYLDRALETESYIHMYTMFIHKNKKKQNHWWEWLPDVPIKHHCIKEINRSFQCAILVEKSKWCIVANYTNRITPKTDWWSVCAVNEMWTRRGRRTRPPTTRNSIKFVCTIDRTINGGGGSIKASRKENLPPITQHNHHNGCVNMYIVPTVYSTQSRMYTHAFARGKIFD